MKILIIEGKKPLAESLKTLLKHKGLDIKIVSDGISGLEYAELGIYDLLILDVTLPDMDGYQLTRKIRASQCGTPILMLTEGLELEDRMKVLDSGADYYIAKPFDNRELLACVHAILRRQGNQFNALSYGGTSLDLFSGTLGCGKKTVRLSAREFEIMRLLLQNPEHNLSKEMILTHVWGYESNAVENNVEVYIRFLRKKLSLIGSDVRIVTIRKLGYHLETESAH